MFRAGYIELFIALLVGLKSYFCFVLEGLGDWSKLFCAFERWARFAFLHPPFPVVSTSVQSAGGGQPPPHTNCTCPSRLGMHHGPRTCFGKHRACVVSRCVVPGCALYSCSEEQCKTPNGVLKNTCPLGHLVLQLCSDSHQGHSFFSKLWVASPAAPWL